MVDEINERMKQGIGTSLGMEFSEIGDDYLKATMPVGGKPMFSHA